MKSLNNKCGKILVTAAAGCPLTAIPSRPLQESRLHLAFGAPLHENHLAPRLPPGKELPPGTQQRKDNQLQKSLTRISKQRGPKT